jgi:hypothetical protein
MASFHLSAPLKKGLLFTFVGPLVGSTPFAIVMGIMGLMEKGNPAVAVLAFVFGYPLGLLPALIAGVLFALWGAKWAARFDAHPKLAAALVGAACGAVGGLALTLLINGDTGRPAPFMFVLYASPAMLAGAVCGWRSLRLEAGPVSIGAWLVGTVGRWLLALAVLAAVFALLAWVTN